MNVTNKFNLNKNILIILHINLKYIIIAINANVDNQHNTNDYNAYSHSYQVINGNHKIILYLKNQYMKIIKYSNCYRTTIIISICTISFSIIISISIGFVVSMFELI